MITGFQISVKKYAWPCCDAPRWECCVWNAATTLICEYHMDECSSNRVQRYRSAPCSIIFLPSEVLECSLLIYLSSNCFQLSFIKMLLFTHLMVRSFFLLILVAGYARAQVQFTNTNWDGITVLSPLTITLSFSTCQSAVGGLTCYSSRWEGDGGVSFSRSLLRLTKPLALG